MMRLLARPLLVFFLFFGLAGAPAYEIYRATSHEAIDSIVTEWEEAALREPSSKPLRTRRDLQSSPVLPPHFGSVARKGTHFTALSHATAWVSDAALDLHQALGIFRI